VASLRRRAIGALVAALVLPACAQANRDDYIDETFVYQTLDRGELEWEVWAETRESPDRQTHAWYTTGLEYGVTERWTLDCAAQAVDRDHGLEFGRLRAETRYRFVEAGVWPADIAVSGEYEHESDAATAAEAENTFTPRLVVSRDILPRLNTTLNLDLPIRLTGGSDVTFAYALGIAYPADAVARAGVELKQEPSEHTATLFPQLMFDLPHELTMKAGTGFGLTSETDRFVGRIAMELEF
jgi:hypothetical protein